MAKDSITLHIKSLIDIPEHVRIFCLYLVKNPRLPAAIKLNKSNSANEAMTLICRGGMAPDPARARSRI